MTPDPIPMLLWCPECGARHVDAGAFATKSHHTHCCQNCGFCWRPAVVATVGVQFLPGFKDEAPLPPEGPPGKPSPAAHENGTGLPAAPQGEPEPLVVRVARCLAESAYPLRARDLAKRLRATLLAVRAAIQERPEWFRMNDGRLPVHLTAAGRSAVAASTAPATRAPGTSPPS